MITVLKVDRENGQACRVVMLVNGNIRIVFVKTNNGFRITSKAKTDAQIYDPAECWISANQLNGLYRQVAAIFNPRPSKVKQQKLF